MLKAKGRSLSRGVYLFLAAVVLSASLPTAEARYSPNCEEFLRGRDFRKSAQVRSSSFGPGMRAELHRMAERNHHPLYKSEYREALYDNLEVNPRHQVIVKDVYCNETYNVPSRYSQMYNIINVEHTWPQSKFSRRYDKSTQKMDLHHLFIANAKVNGSRGNYEFGVVVDEARALDCDDPKLGYDREGRMVFEPPNSHKGAVARAIFYFAVRYEMPLSPQQEEVLRQWNKQFPVSAEERYRNDRIEDLQGNRNPFIDNPGLVEQVESWH